MSINNIKIFSSPALENVKIYGKRTVDVRPSAKRNIIVANAQNKEVLHVGCTDAPLTRDVLNSNDLLHVHLEKVAKSLIGIDIADDAIEFLQSRGISSIIKMDAENIQLEQKFDLIVAGDIIEHMSNPGLFLQQVNNYLKKDGILIISVPNAFSFITTIWMWLTNRERIHKDHCFYFSPKTCVQLCSRYDLLPTALTFANSDTCRGNGKIGWRVGGRLFVNLFRQITLFCFPAMAPTIIMEFKNKVDIDENHYIELRY